MTYEPRDLGAPLRKKKKKNLDTDATAVCLRQRLFSGIGHVAKASHQCGLIMSSSKICRNPERGKKGTKKKKGLVKTGFRSLMLSELRDNAYQAGNVSWQRESALRCRTVACDAALPCLWIIRPSTGTCNRLAACVCSIRAYLGSYPTSQTDSKAIHHCV